MILAALVGFAVLAARASLASKFEESFTLLEGRRLGPIVEGPMYGTDGAFVGFVSGSPYVGFEGVAQFLAGADMTAIHANLTIYHTSSIDLLPMFDSSLPLSERLLNSSVIMCDNSKGLPTKQAMHAFGKLEFWDFYPIAGNDGQKSITFKSPVVRTAYQYIIFILCRKHHRAGLLASVEVSVDGTLQFRNPYGFLPARYYGFLPFLGILSSLYLAMLLIFGYLAIRYRKTMLRMQWGILLVIIMGLVETTTWFLTYVVMNDSGGTSCCPWRSDIVFAMFAKNLKQTVSGLLVLAVAMGWGVVRAYLPRKTTVAVLGLGTFYLAFAVKFDLVRMERISRATHAGDSEPSGNSAFWAFPVALCDVLFILSIYFSLVETSQELENDHQDAKLQMYQRLTKTLRFWGILWLLFTMFDLATRVGVIPWPWTLEFMLWSFWDVLYFFVLLRIAIIWRPTETSDRYAYSTQLPTGNILDEFETNEFEASSATKENELQMNKN